MRCQGHRVAPIVASLLCQMPLLTSPAAHAATGATQVQDIPQGAQLIPALPRSAARLISEHMDTLTTWPSTDFIAKHKARKDRSRDIPAVYPKGVADPKPLRLGALSPRSACQQAEQWIRDVVRAKWIPEDLTQRLLPLQVDPAWQSTVLCRYRLRGHAIQIAQTRSLMCVVIAPATEGREAVNEKLGPQVFRQFLHMGDRMAALPSRPVETASPLHVRLPDQSKVPPAGALENWWGWILWYTDGRAVAIFLRKQSEDSARMALPDEPWF